MPKTLDIQGISGLREEVVRTQSSPSCSPVQQALILLSVTPENFGFPGFSYVKSYDT